MKRAGIFCLLIVLITWAGPSAGAVDHGRIPAAVALRINKAEQLMAAGKTAEGIDLLKTFQAKRSGVSADKADRRGYTHYLVDFILGNAYLTLEDAAAAARHYRAVVQKKPDFTQAQFNLARSLYDLNRSAEAARAFVAAYEASGGQTVDALYYGAVCFMRAEDYPGALKTFQRLLDSHPASLTDEWRQSLARLYLVMKKPALALPHVELLADRLEGERRREWREALIYVYLQLDMKDKALVRVASYTRDDSLEAKWWKIHAWLLLERQDYRRALTSLTACSYLEILSGQERELLGDINFVAGVPLEAVRHYESRLENRSEPDLFKKTARGFLRLYDEEQALTWIERGLKIAPDDQDLLTMKGYLLYEADRLAEAAAVYKKLADLSPTSGEHWLMRGYIAWRQGEIDTAVKSFKKAAEYKKYARQARQALEHLQ